MPTRRGLLAAFPALAAAALALPGTAEAQSITLNFGPPPPPRNARPTPPPRRGYVWQPGHYRWNGRRHVWVEGQWIRERRGRHYRNPEWVQHDGRWVYRPGRWD